ncbi:hypothetical protein MKMG_02239 [Methanogenium sp. MK-MG]|nr:hypothetical protein MKMG_02239 [Methanogenium sp. MK-MG]
MFIWFTVHILCWEVLRIPGYVRITLLILFFVVIFLTAPVMAAGIYSVEAWDTLPPGGNEIESLPISWWEVPPLAFFCFMVCLMCPLFYQPVILLYAAGVWCTLGFRRATRQDVLTQPVRAEVYDYIKVHPGTPFSVIEKKMEINRGTLHYHLYILLREGRISEWREGGHTTYFENNGKYSMDEKRILSRLHSGTAGEICRFLAQRHGATRTEIARWIGIAPSSVSWHLSRLNSGGIVVSEKCGRKTTYCLTSCALTLLCTCLPDKKYPIE